VSKQLCSFWHGKCPLTGTEVAKITTMEGQRNAATTDMISYFFTETEQSSGSDAAASPAMSAVGLERHYPLSFSGNHPPEIVVRPLYESGEEPTAKGGSVDHMS